MATAASDDQIVLGIQEVPASQAMEMGRACPTLVKCVAKFPKDQDETVSQRALAAGELNSQLLDY